MRRVHTRGALSGLLALLALLAACGASPPPATPGTPGAPEVRSVTMRLQWIPQYQFAGYIVALEKGYYADAGLEVEILPGSPDFVPLPLVASGADTFGSTGADTILLAQEKDIDVVALATLFQTSPVAFMVHQDAGIASPADFAGRTVGVSYGDNVETEYRALLAAAGVNRADINEVPIQVNMEPFLRRRVDVWPVYATDQPDLARQQGAEVDLIVARDYGVRLMGDVLFAQRAFVERNPATTQAFVSATLRGWHDALANPDEAVEILAAFSPELSREHLAFEAAATAPLMQAGVGAACVGWNQRAAWEAERDLLHELGIIGSAVESDAAVEPRFVQAYYEQAGEACPAP